MLDVTQEIHGVKKPKEREISWFVLTGLLPMSFIFGTRGEARNAFKHYSALLVGRCIAEE